MRCIVVLSGAADTKEMGKGEIRLSVFHETRLIAAETRGKGDTAICVRSRRRVTQAHYVR